MLDAAARRELLPSSAIPLAYFACAHAGLATALAVLIVRPDTPGGFFFHQRMVALVHLVGAPPPRGANQLPSGPFAKTIILTWAPAIPPLAAGLGFESQPAIAVSAALLLCGVCSSAAYVVYLMRAPWRPLISKEQ